MTSTNYERDFEDLKSKLAWPGRFNPRLLQNVDDVGDGFPGLQKAIRNWVRDQAGIFSPVDPGESIQTVIDSLETIGGGGIYLRPGIHGGADAFPLTIDDPTASIVILGAGETTVIDVGADLQTFDISDALSVILQDFKIDATDMTTQGKIVIGITSNTPTTIDNVTIEGDGTNGIGIYSWTSDYITIENCTIHDLFVGTWLEISEYLIVKNNRVYNCVQAGLYIYTDSHYFVVAGNICYLNGTAGIAITECDHGVVSGNTCFGNTGYGIFLTGAENNAITGNVANNNDSNEVLDTGGIHLDIDCLYNLITGNTCNDNDNSGGGEAYGININHASDVENVLGSNSLLNNQDGDYQDNGTDTIFAGGSGFVEIVRTTASIQTAIDKVLAAGGGTVFLLEGVHNDGVDAFPLTINDASGNIIITGHGDAAVIDPNGDDVIIDVQDCVYCLIKDIRLDCTDHSSPATEGILVSGGSGVIIDGVSAFGGNGIRIEIAAAVDDVIVRNCQLDGGAVGVYSGSDDNLIIGNRVAGTGSDGILLLGTADRNLIIGNILDNIGSDGIAIVAGADDNIIGPNHFYNIGILNVNDGGTGTIIYGSDTAYGVGWNGNLGTATKNAIYDQMEAIDPSNADIYYCNSEAEINAAITAIGANAGIIVIESGTIVLAATINVAGGGSYVFQGMGDKTIIDCGGNRRAFYVTSADSCVFRDFLIDGRDITTFNLGAIEIDESADNKCIVENMTFQMDSTLGYSVEILSENCIVKKSHFSGTALNHIYVVGHRTIIEGNWLSGAGTANINIVGADYCVVNGNICQGASSGIESNGGEHTTITNNNCTGAALAGIQLATAHRSVVTGNNCDGNVRSGILLSGSNYCTITGNSCCENDCNQGNNEAGIKISNNSDYNIVSGNNSSENNNASGFDSYGILVDDAASNENSIGINQLLNNDGDILDNGTDTIIIAMPATYYCTTRAEIVAAITAIGTGGGLIKMVPGTMAVTSEIAVNGGGSYIFEGFGNDTILQVSNNRAFNVTSAQSCLFQDFAIDGEDQTFDVDGIYIAEGSDHMVTVQRIYFFSRGAAGQNRCVEIRSNNVVVRDCKVEECWNFVAIEAAAMYCKIVDNHIENCSLDVVRIVSGSRNIIANNTSIGSGNDFVFLQSGSYNIIADNYCQGSNNLVTLPNTGGADHTKITGNTVYNVTQDAINIYNIAGHDNTFINDNIFDTVGGHAINLQGANIDNTLIGINMFDTITGSDVNDLGTGTSYGARYS